MLLGHPVAHSLSPLFQSAALRAAGLDVTYEAVNVPPDRLAEALAGLVAERAGGNVTVPHKEAVARVCQRLTPLAERIGAVNVFWVEDGALWGDNTDAGGFAAAVASLGCATPGSGDRVAVLGAGGAAAAVLAAVGQWPGALASVYNRTPARALALCARAGAHARAVVSVDDALAGARLVVNATTVGLRDDAQPVDVARLPAGANVIDLVYRPGGTAWVRAARARGHRAIDGLPMLIEQGALAFERWFGVPPDRDAMWRAVAAR